MGTLGTILVYSVRMYPYFTKNYEISSNVSYTGTLWVNSVQHGCIRYKRTHVSGRIHFQKKKGVIDYTPVSKMHPPSDESNCNVDDTIFCPVICSYIPPSPCMLDQSKSCHVADGRKLVATKVARDASGSRVARAQRESPPGEELNECERHDMCGLLLENKNASIGLHRQGITQLMLH